MARLSPLLAMLFTALAATAAADEGMWTFDAPPTKLVAVGDPATGVKVRVGVFTGVLVRVGVQVLVGLGVPGVPVDAVGVSVGPIGVSVAVVPLKRYDW